MGDVNRMPGHLIRRYQQAAVAIFHQQLDGAEVDLTPVQYAALAKVQAYPGVDQVTLAGLIAYDRSTIGGVVDRLVQKGWLERAVSDTDRRARVLKLTGAGEQTLARVTPAVEEAQAIMLRGLDAQEQATFLNLLEKATESVNELSRAPLKTAD